MSNQETASAFPLDATLMSVKGIDIETQSAKHWNTVDVYNIKHKYC